MVERRLLQFFFSFSGCESRSTFWPAIVLNFVMYLLLAVPAAVELSNNISAQLRNQLWLIIPAIILLIANRWALIARRLHDTGRSFLIYLLLKGTGILLFYLPIIVAAGNRAEKRNHYFSELHYLSLIPLVVLCILLCLPSKKNAESNDNKKQR